MPSKLEFKPNICRLKLRKNLTNLKFKVRLNTYPKIFKKLYNQIELINIEKLR